MHPGDAPGLGVDLDEALAATYPYDPAYLPVARRLDGTVLGVVHTTTVLLPVRCQLYRWLEWNCWFGAPAYAA